MWFSQRENRQQRCKSAGGEGNGRARSVGVAEGKGMTDRGAGTGVRLILDISRLLRTARRTSPSGIDRVEFAYARHLLAHWPSACFLARDPWHRFYAVPRPLVERLVATIGEDWAEREAGAPPAALGTARLIQGRLLLGLGRREFLALLRQSVPRLLLHVAHSALERPGALQRLRATGVAFVPLIHDLIPATHPEYARPGEAERHLRRIATTAELADGVIVNSAATAEALAPHLARRADPPPVLVAPLGTDQPQVPAPPVPLEPYFVVLGTIEPRKNHLLLLNLWRQFAARMGAAAPRLLIVGRRGWENENIVDMLDRCAALRPIVQELGPLPDRRVAALLKGARALLFPSFVEGYGLPLVEALSLGTPVICSDLPALREVGGDVPDYLDPLDGAAWRALILDYAKPGSPARRAQLQRLARWRAPCWQEHFARVEAFLHRLPAVGSALAPRPALAPEDRPLARPARESP
jgi:glycosyltransferase involved in cell wall biosynthesis